MHYLLRAVVTNRSFDSQTRLSLILTQIEVEESHGGTENSQLMVVSGLGTFG